jgi:hypothetical protein
VDLTWLNPTALPAAVETPYLHLGPLMVLVGGRIDDDECMQQQYVKFTNFFCNSVMPLKEYKHTHNSVFLSSNFSRLSEVKVTPFEFDISVEFEAPKPSKKPDPDLKSSRPFSHE